MLRKINYIWRYSLEGLSARKQKFQNPGRFCSKSFSLKEIFEFHIEIQLLTQT